MKWSSLLMILAFSLFSLHCQPVGRLQKSFDQIEELVKGRTAEEVEELLGPPDLRQRVLLGDELWIWWNYTYLDGEDYAPEVRRRAVHLEITFRNPSTPGGPRLPYSKWRVVTPYGVSYSGLPLRSRMTPLSNPPTAGVSRKSF